MKMHRSGIGGLLVAVALMAIAGATSARAQTLATVQSQSTYPAYNPWTGWETWLPAQCTETQKVYVSEPSGGGKYPVFIYMHGTLSDWSGNVEGQVVAQLAAAQGFVAIAPSYDSFLTLTPNGVDAQATCIFGQSNPGNIVSYACSLPEADCSNGVVVGGFSQGGAIAVRAANHSPQVTAAWAMGVTGPTVPGMIATPAGTRVLPNHRVRINVGQADVTNQVDLSGVRAVTGDNCTSYQCLQSDGSGYYAVSNAEVADGGADHCYWMQVTKAGPGYSCSLYPTAAGLDPGFAPPSVTPWSLVTNLNWLRGQL